MCISSKKTKFSIVRHLKRKHDGAKICRHYFKDQSKHFDDENQSGTFLLQSNKKANADIEKGNEEDTSYCQTEVGNEDTSLAQLLTEIGLQEYLHVFITQKIDLEMLLNLDPDDFSEMFQDIANQLAMTNRSRMELKTIEETSFHVAPPNQSSPTEAESSCNC